MLPNQRVALSGGVVLTSQSKEVRAAWSSLLSLVVVVRLREMLPFSERSTNRLAVLTHWIIVLVFTGAFLLVNDSFEEVRFPMSGRF